jgi:endonuclease/exonuclease/phosphatase (EEP) superfamily protein YafD
VLKSSRIFLIFSVSVIFLNISGILPLYFSESKECEINHKLKFLHANVLTSNRNSSKLINLIRSVEPDFLLLNEVNFRWIKELQDTVSLFPFKAEFPREDNFGIAVYSKLKDVNYRFEFFDGFEIPSVICDFSLNKKEFCVIYTHLVPPGSKDMFELRNHQLENIMDFLKNNQKTVILAGDLNLTSFSRLFRDFINNTGLKDSRIGRGIQPSWPVGASFFYITLDHFLVSQDVCISERKTMNNIYSDHFPVYIEIEY